MPGERDIEKQLRAGAAQRRRAAGAPFVPPSAARRLWQGEVRRVHGRDKPGRAGRLSLFSGLWLRLAFGGCALLLAAAVFLPALSQSKFRSQQVAKSTRRPELKMAGEINAVATVSRVDQSVAPSPAVMLKSIAPAEVAPAEGRADKPAGGGPPGQGADRETVVAARPAPVALGLAPPPAAMPASPPPTQNLYFRNAVVSGNDLAAQSNGLMKDDGKLKMAGGALGGRMAAENDLLDSFQVERSGDRLRIIDRDGSIYNGSLLADASVAKAEFVRRELSRAPTVPAGQTGAPAYSGDLGLNQGFRFRAAGTNVSLRQSVAISGEFVSGSDLATNAGVAVNRPTNQFQNAVRAGGAPLPSSPQLSNGRIVGKAVLGDGREVPLDAAVVSP